MKISRYKSEAVSYASNFFYLFQTNDLNSIPYLASKHKWDGAVGACYFTVAQHWGKAIQAFDAGRHSLCARALQSISDWGAGQPLPRALPAACSWRAPSFLSSVRGRRRCDAFIQQALVNWVPTPRLIFTLDSIWSARRSERVLYLRELWESHAAYRDRGVLQWEEEEEGKRAAGSRVKTRGTVCSAATRDPPAAEEPFPWLSTRRKEEKPRTLSRAATIQTRRGGERGEVSRLEGEGRAAAFSLLHSSLERNWRVVEPNVAQSGRGDGGGKNGWDSSELKRDAKTAFGQERKEYTDSKSSSASLGVGGVEIQYYRVIQYLTSWDHWCLKSWYFKLHFSFGIWRKRDIDHHSKQVCGRWKVL